MLSLARIGILEKCRAVKLRKPVCILREMRRYPVQDHADLVLVAFVYEVCKILRCAVAGGRCVISGNLIAPGTIKRILGDSHKLDMRVAHLLHIGNQRFCQLTICIKAFILTSRMAHP